LLPSLLLVAAVALYPVASGVWLGFQRYNLLHTPSPSFIGLGQYVDLWGDTVFWTSVRNTALLPIFIALRVLGMYDTHLVDGKVYGVPSFAFVNWMYYRADWFKEAGLAPPKTFDDFQAAAVKLTDPSKNRFGFGMRGGGGGEGMLIEVIARLARRSSTTTSSLPWTDRRRPTQCAGTRSSTPSPRRCPQASPTTASSRSRPAFRPVRRP
jgi:hypothetical protein